MTSALDRACTICGTSTEEAQLERCVMCLRYYCFECAYKGSGRRFCSAHCSESFFHHGDEDDENADADFD